MIKIPILCVLTSSPVQVTRNMTDTKALNASKFRLFSPKQLKFQIENRNFVVKKAF